MRKASWTILLIGVLLALMVGCALVKKAGEEYVKTEEAKYGDEVATAIGPPPGPDAPYDEQLAWMHKALMYYQGKPNANWEFRIFAGLYILKQIILMVKAWKNGKKGK